MRAPSCGVCGKGALEAVAVEAPEVASELRAPAALLSELPERLRDRQPAFAETGGLHATGLFDPKGELLCLREDVGDALAELATVTVELDLAQLVNVNGPEELARL